MIHFLYFTFTISFLGTGSELTECSWRWSSIAPLISFPSQVWHSPFLQLCLQSLKAQFKVLLPRFHSHYGVLSLTHLLILLLQYRIPLLPSIFFWQFVCMIFIDVSLVDLFWSILFISHNSGMQQVCCKLYIFLEIWQTFCSHIFLEKSDGTPGTV